VVAVEQSRQTLPCVKCGHLISIERVGNAIVVKSTSRGWVRCVVFHLEHLTGITKKE
jgi:hypothetical protein